MSADPSRQAKTPASDDDLLRAWGLRRAPFAADEKSRGIFASASHSEALTFMDTTAALRGVMLLTGPPGSGKSTVLKSWMAALEPKRFLPLLITQASLSATGVLEIILAKTGTSPKPASIAISSHKLLSTGSPKPPMPSPEPSTSSPDPPGSSPLALTPPPSSPITSTMPSNSSPQLTTKSSTLTPFLAAAARAPRPHRRHFFVLTPRS